MSSEKTPLLPTPPRGREDAPPAPPVIAASPTAYFLDGAHRRKPSNFSVESEIDTLPSQATSSSEFNSRPVSGKNITATNEDGFKRITKEMRAPSVGGDWLSYIARSRENVPSAPREDDFAAESGEMGTLLIPRKVPVKVEPKVHFSNER